jgi:hypothetical protein
MKFQIWPNDATTVVEKIAYVMMKVFAPALYLFGQASALGIFHNIYTKNCEAAEPFWHIVGFILFIISVGYGFLVFRDSNYVSKNSTVNGIVIFFAAALSLLSYAGFVFNG